MLMLKKPVLDQDLEDALDTGNAHDRIRNRVIIVGDPRPPVRPNRVIHADYFMVTVLTSPGITTGAWCASP